MSLPLTSTYWTQKAMLTITIIVFSTVLTTLTMSKVETTVLVIFVVTPK